MCRLPKAQEGDEPGVKQLRIAAVSSLTRSSPFRSRQLGANKRYLALNTRNLILWGYPENKPNNLNRIQNIKQLPPAMRLTVSRT